MKITIIVGTRPQIIKSQPIIKELLLRKVNLHIIHTGQHYDYQMSKAFFDELKIRNPDINLGIKEISPTKQLSQIISKLEKPLMKLKPDFVLIPGDTRSALGAALCTFRLGFKVAHIEAGARSYDFELEEEINRRIIDQCSHLLFAPTPTCYKNLKKEGLLGSAFFTGDTMYDVFLEFKKKIGLEKSRKGKFVLITLHRKNNIENFQQINKIIQMVKKIVKSGHEVLFPIHPHTKKQIKSFRISLEGIKTIEPVKYSRMLQLLCDASLLITDSGGLQKEAYWLNTPCITLRKSTEWIETLQGKHNKLIGNITRTSSDDIKRILKKNHTINKNFSNIEFGRGNASKKIVSVLERNISRSTWRET